MDAPYRIRPAILADAASLVAIERRAFGDPWSEASFREALTSAWTFVLVAQTGRGVAGYLVGREAGGTGEVLNLAVAPEERRKGIATFALQKIDGIAWAYGLPRIELEVRETNLAAQLLYRSTGYRAVDILHTYYGDQDAYKMTKDVLLPFTPPRGARGTRRTPFR